MPVRVPTRPNGPAGVLADERFRRALETFGPAAALLALQGLWFRESPFSLPGLYLYGLTLGVLSALVALGMALVYRANRILNFAQGDLGLVSTIFALHLVSISGVPYFFGLALGLMGALLVGGLVEFLIIRRFFKSPRLILTVATIGLSQLLRQASVFIPMIWGKDPTGLPQVQPFDFTLSIHPITFASGTVLALIMAPLALVAVVLFLQFTSAGMAIRASAERVDRAALLGIPVKRLNTLVWMIAALLSFVGVFFRGAMNGIPFAEDGYGTTTMGTLLVALAALALGRFTNLTAVVTSAIALGVLEQQVVYHNGRNPAIVYPVFGVVILVALGIRKASQARADHDLVASWQAADEIRPIPFELRRIPEVVVAKWGGLALLVYVAMRLPYMPFMSESELLKASAVLVFGMVGISIILLTGWAGQVSLGQMAFVGVGSAVGALVTRQWELDLTIALFVSGFAGAIVAVIVGLPALRVRGLLLGVTTLAFAATSAYYLLNPVYFSWIPTKRIERPPLFGIYSLDSQAAMYWFCLACLILVVLAVTGLRRSRTGRALLALRENERAAQSYGINIIRAKLVGFALSGFLAAFAGCLLVHITRSFSIASFTSTESLNVFTGTVIGGLGGQTGALLGALYVQGGSWFLPRNFQALSTAVGVLLVLLIFPGGFSSLVFQVRDRWLRSVARRFEILVPSLVADLKVDELNVMTNAEEQVEAIEIGVSASASHPFGPDGGALGEQQPPPPPSSSPPPGASVPSVPLSSASPQVVPAAAVGRPTPDPEGAVTGNGNSSSSPVGGARSVPSTAPTRSGPPQPEPPVVATTPTGPNAPPRPPGASAGPSTASARPMTGASDRRALADAIDRRSWLSKDAPAQAPSSSSRPEDGNGEPHPGGAL